MNGIQELSRKKMVTQQQDLNPDTGISNQVEEFRAQLPSGGVAQAVHRTCFNDANGEPVDDGAKLYRTPDRQLLTGRSVFRCLCCHAYYPRSKGNELQPANTVDLVNNDTPSIEPPAPDPMMAPMMRQAAEGKPYTGFCEVCWKQEKRKRFWSAIVGFFVNPLKAMITPQPEQDLPPQVVVIVPPLAQDDRHYRRPPYSYGRQAMYRQPINPDPNEG